MCSIAQATLVCIIIGWATDLSWTLIIIDVCDYIYTNIALMEEMRIFHRNIN